MESAERAGALEYSMSLSALEEIELRELDILVHSGVLQADADAYNPGFTTNCAACVNKYSEMHGLISAGPLLVGTGNIFWARRWSARTDSIHILK